MREKTTTRFRNMLKEPGVIVMPGVYDALTAKIAESVGFNIITHTGAGVAASLLGQPDVGLVSFKEMRDSVASIARAVEIPVFSDADTGYGNPINVYRTVKEYIWAGAAGLFIEDQKWPKRCGHLSGKQLVPVEEMVAKIKAAVDSRNDEDPDFVFGVRCDAIAVEGFSEAIKRAKVYSSLGIDFIFIDAYENIEQMREAVKEIDVPLLLNQVEGGKTPLISTREAEEMGFKIFGFPLATVLASTKAVREVLELLKQTGSARSYLDRTVMLEEFFNSLGLRTIAEMDRKYK